MTEPIRITVDVSDRVDKALARHFPDAGRRQLAELFDAGHVKVAGKRAKKGDRVAPGDVVELAVSPVSGDALVPLPEPEAAAKLVVLVERPDLVVISKPAGMPSQPLRAGELGTATIAVTAGSCTGSTSAPRASWSPRAPTMPTAHCARRSARARS